MKKFPTTRKTKSAPHWARASWLLAAVFVAAVLPAKGVVGPAHASTPNVDKRHAIANLNLRDQKKNALLKLEQSVPGVKVSLDPVLNAPHWVQTTEGFLAKANGAGAANQDHHALIKSFVDQHADLFGYNGGVMNGAKVKRDYVTPHNGVHTIVWEQHLDDIPVFEAQLMGHVTKNGDLINISTHLLADAAGASHRDAASRAKLESSPVISARQALLIAARDIGQSVEDSDIQVAIAPSGPEQSQHLNAGKKLFGDNYVHLTWLPLDGANVRLCWQVMITAGNPIERFHTLVDAETGEVLVRHNLTFHISPATYRVWTSDSPSPFSPGLSTPSPFQPPLTDRSLITISALDTNASPNGWIDDSNNTTTGNNVDCFLDRDADFLPDGPRPTGNPNRVFDFPIDLTADPSTYTNASVVHMFYWQNWYHDKVYQLGFTEAAGNYQQNNFNRGGLGNDPIIAHCQFGADVGITDNSAFLSAPDGQSGNIIEFIFDFPKPNRDGAIDQEVYLHESTHGLSTRLVGGGVDITALQSAGMGEGWSDFYGLSLLSETNDDPNACYAEGGYVTYQFAGLQENYYFGIRHYPYSTDMLKNPFTLKDIDPTQISRHTGVPLSSLYPFDPREADEVHHQGEVWCVTLWGVRANLIAKYGTTAGNQLMLRLVTDGMKLGPANPTFLEARDAIIAADRVDNNGADVNDIWRGFAKRGMGVGAFVPVNSTTVGVIESYNIPGLAYVTNVISGGNGNALLDPNECANMDIVLTNSSSVSISSISAKLTSLTKGVFITQPFSTWPTIPVGGSAIERTTFRVSTTPELACGSPVTFALVVTSSQDVRTNVFQVTLGSTGSPIGFTNSIPVAIPDADQNGVLSSVTVTNFSGSIAHATVSVFITHPFDADLRLELIAPDGTTVLLSANNGFGANYGFNCTPDSSRTTFDDSATAAITSAFPPFIGSFQPEQPLALLNLKSGTNVNGTWKLHVVDEFAFNTGALDCWTLSLTPYICTDGGGECPGSDLSVTMTDSPDPVLVSSNLLYTMVVSNAGPSTAHAVVLNQSLPSTVQFIAASTTVGTVTQSVNTVTADIGVLPVYGSATVTVLVRPLTNGLISSTANVGSPAPDGDMSNNSVTVVTRVEKPTADVAVTLTETPNPAIDGGVITYTATVTNNGPFTATGVTLTNFLPANAQVISVATSQGSFAVAGNIVLASLGNVSVGAAATVSISVTPTSPGLLNATAQVAEDSFIFDPVPGNNRSSVSTTVNPGADVGVSAVSTPSSVVLGGRVTYTITFSNRGPDMATAVVMNDVLPAAATITFATSTAGTVTTDANTVTCAVDTMAPGSNVVVTVIATAPSTPTNAQTLVSFINVSSATADPNLLNNSLTLRTSAAPPFIDLVAAGATLTAESFTPHNGAIDVGETVTLQLSVQNNGNITASNVTATLLTGGGVSSPSGPQSYGTLRTGASASAPFTFVATGVNGGTVLATLQLQTNGVFAGNATFTFGLPLTKTFSNTNLITIVDATPSGPSPAIRYPATLQVAGVTGFVSRVTVTLSNLTHTYPDDIGALVVGPSSRSSILMAHAGGGNSASNVSLTFDRSAAQTVPDSGQLVSTRYVPAAYGSENTGAAYAFPTNFALPAGPYTANLAAFEGGNVNGTWSLFVADDSPGDSGAISNGWSVAVTTVRPINPIADLFAVPSVVGAPQGTVVLGNDVTFLLVVKNAGPFDATSVTVTNTLSAGLSLVSITGAYQSATTIGQQTVITFPQLAFGSNVVLTVTAHATAIGKQTNSVSVGGNEVDLNSQNNVSAASITVIPPSADVGVGVTASANPLPIGNNLVYTVTVTNRGPNVALSTVVTDTLPLGFNFGSVSVPSGGYNVSGNGTTTISLNFGNLAANSSATATIVCAPQTPGTYTNTFSLTTSSTDSNSADNAAPVVTTVIQPTPVIIAGGVHLISESGAQDGAVDQNETVTVQFTLANIGTAPTTNLVATLQNSGGVTAGTTAQNYGAIAAGASGTQAFTFTGTGAAGATDVATLTLSDGTATFNPVTFSFVVPGSKSFTNNSAITIPTLGPASPYPSSIIIGNLPGVVSKATVKLNHLTHSFPHDVNVLLVSPSGQSAVILSHCGGAHSVTNVDITLDDAAASSLSDTNLIVSGTYKPTANSPTASFPGISIAGGTTLSAVNGSLANGTWSLYVDDDSAGDGGSIAGWTLTLTVANTINPASALSISMTGTPASLYSGNYVDYTINVANAGPSPATNVIIADTIPANAHCVSGSFALGSIDSSSNPVKFTMTSLAAGATASAYFRVTAAGAPAMTNTATVSADVADLYLGDNTASVVTILVDPTPATLTGSYANGSGFNLTLTGQNGETYQLQYSTDLQTWTTIATTTLSTGSFSLNDTGAVSSQTRYYRAYRVPH